jgi:hypothetical protein
MGAAHSRFEVSGARPRRSPAVDRNDRPADVGSGGRFSALCTGYCVVYVASFEDAVYVLHAFQKK